MRSRRTVSEMFAFEVEVPITSRVTPQWSFKCGWSWKQCTLGFKKEKGFNCAEQFAEIPRLGLWYDISTKPQEVWNHTCAQCLRELNAQQTQANQASSSLLWLASIALSFLISFAPRYPEICTTCLGLILLHENITSSPLIDSNLNLTLCSHRMQT